LSLLAEKSIKEVVLPFLKFKIENLSTILRGMDRTLRNLSRKISKIDAELCLIHGDATFENLAYSESRGIMLLNPIGARIDPCFKRKSTELGYAAKIFDQSRMFLTSKWNYDIWNISLRAHVENNVLSISENVSFHDAQFFEVVDTLIWDDLLYPQATRDDVMAFAIIDLVRILRYKIGARDLPQALWIIGLLERELGIEL
jgi:hypothetical protein